jgi:hypothetical protein
MPQKIGGVEAHHNVLFLSRQSHEDPSKSYQRLWVSVYPPALALVHLAVPLLFWVHRKSLHVH